MKSQAHRVQIQHVQKVPRNVAPWWFSKKTVFVFGCACFAYVASQSNVWALAATFALGAGAGIYGTLRVTKTTTSPDPPEAAEEVGPEWAFDPYGDGEAKAA